MKKQIISTITLSSLFILMSCKEEKLGNATLTLNTNMSDIATLEGSGEYKMKSDVEINAKAHLGYDFLGWYYNDKLISEELNYKFQMPKKDITYTAKFELDNDISNLEFNSNYDTCEIKGIKNKDLKNIIIPSYVTNIDEGALYGCGSVETLSIPFVGSENKEYGKGIVYPLGYIFGKEEFQGASAINQRYRDTVVTEDSYFSTIDNKTYYIPDSLNEVSITNSYLLPSYAFSKTNIKKLTIKNIKKIDTDALRESNIEKVYFDGTLSDFSKIDFEVNSLFGNYDLYYKEDDNYHLFDSNLIIPNDVEKLSNNMFNSYVDLVNLNFGSNIKYIGEYVFDYCVNLKNIYFDGTIDEWINIKFYDLSSCPLRSKLDRESSNVKSFYILDKNGDISFNDKKYKLVTDIETSINTIKQASFFGYGNLGVVRLKDGVEKIEEDAFALSSMKELYIPSTVTYIDEEAFDSCKNLKLIHNYSNIDITIEKYGLEEDCVITKE
jgi:uncharacterized repeat protein (TIGR02543 family)